MKKLTIIALTTLLSGTCIALPLGNPSEASLLGDGIIWEASCGDPCDPCISDCEGYSFRLGFYGDYVFNRHLRDSNSIDDRVIEHAHIFTNAGYLAFNVWDRFDIFGTVGTSNFGIESSLHTGVGRFEIETNTRVSWSVGGRVTLWCCDCTILGLEGQYFQTNPKVKRVTIDDDISIYPSSSVKSTYTEWQVGLGLSHRIRMFVPYIGFKWSGVRISSDDAFFTYESVGDGFTRGDPTLTLYDLENDKSWGWVAGVSLIDCERAALTVEGRFADEKALYVNGQVRF